MITSDIFDIIFLNANVEPFEGTYCAIRKQLRYYRDDIPTSPRYLYDADAVYFYNVDSSISNVMDKNERRDLAERGDIMTSIWAPLTYYLKLNNGRIIEKNNKNIDMILENNMTCDVFQLFSYLSEKYASRGNLLLLPNSKNRFGKRSLNPDKFRVSEDKIDQFLYFCMCDKLIDYFDNKPENVKNWIMSEHLECMFSHEFFQYSLSEIEEGKISMEIGWDDICQENLQSLINDTTKIETYRYRAFQDDDWYTYFERLSKVIAYRNFVKIESHFPLSWRCDASNSQRK